MQTSQRLGVLQPFRVGKIVSESRNAVVYDAVRSLRRTATLAEMQKENGVRALCFMIKGGISLFSPPALDVCAPPCSSCFAGRHMCESTDFNAICHAFLQCLLNRAQAHLFMKSCCRLAFSPTSWGLQAKFIPRAHSANWAQTSSPVSSSQQQSDMYD